MQGSLGLTGPPASSFWEASRAYCVRQAGVERAQVALELAPKRLRLALLGSGHGGQQPITSIYWDGPVDLIEPTADSRALPSLLGRDVLDNFRLTVSKQESLISLELQLPASSA